MSGGGRLEPAGGALPPARQVRWAGWELLLAAGLASLAWFGARALPGLLGGDLPGRRFLATLLLDAGFTLVPLGLLVFRHRRPLLETLFPPERLAQDFGWGLELALVVGALNALSAARAVDALQAAGRYPLYYLEVYNIDGMRKLVLFVFGWGVFSPIAEEIFFRGFLYSALRRRLRAVVAVPASAAAFALIHPLGEPMLAAFVLGMVVATVYEYSGSLLPPVMAHMGLNLSFVTFLAFRGELARCVPAWVLAAGAAVFALHFFLSSRYLFRRPGGR